MIFDMPESFRSRLDRLKFNFFPAFRGTGGRVTYIADDYREVRIKLPLSWRTRNYVGTIYGGSMYGAVDPIYMIMLIKNLGPGYVVWDKAARIRFRKPGKTTLFARFELTEAEITEIKSLAGTGKSVDRHFSIELTDSGGVVHAEIDKTIYIAERDLSSNKGR